MPGCSPKITAEAQELPHPGRAPRSVSRPLAHLQPDPSHQWPVPSGVGTSQATTN